MSWATALTILMIAAPVSSAAFGIIGALTDKKKDGRLTIWGYAAVAGIIVSSSITLVSDRIKATNQAQKDAESAASKLNADKTATELRNRDLRDQHARDVASAKAVSNELAALAAVSDDVASVSHDQKTSSARVLGRVAVTVSQLKRMAQPLTPPSVEFAFSFSIAGLDDDPWVKQLLLACEEESRSGRSMATFNMSEKEHRELYHHFRTKEPWHTISTLVFGVNLFGSGYDRAVMLERFSKQPYLVKNGDFGFVVPMDRPFLMYFPLSHVLSVRSELSSISDKGIRRSGRILFVEDLEKAFAIVHFAGLRNDAITKTAHGREILHRIVPDSFRMRTSGIDFGADSKNWKLTQYHGPMVFIADINKPPPMLDVGW